ncbi:DUF2569 family protein [bacterium]|nr:DUF2569 family protein [bacterium]
MPEIRYSYKKSEYYGVRGWLLFFCIILTIIFPLILLVNVPLNIAAGIMASNLFKSSNCLIIIIIDSTLQVGVGIFSIYAGISLWRIRRGAVQITKVFYIINLIDVLISNVLHQFLPEPSVSNFKITEVVHSFSFGKYFHSLICPILIFAISFSYFCLSRRVKATYRDA